jgi:hypothetical protein
LWHPGHTLKWRNILTNAPMFGCHWVERIATVKGSLDFMGIEKMGE